MRRTGGVLLGPRFAILGPLEVRHGDAIVPIVGARRRALLLRLLLGRNQVVSSDRLIDDLWGDAPPQNPLNALQAYISYLRQALGAAAILTRKPGYVLEIDEEEVDAGLFLRRAEEGRAALAAEDADRALDALVAALALWRGPALAEFADEPFARAEAASLEERRRVVLEERFDAELAVGRHDVVMGELEMAASAHPYRERLWGQLMLALYRCGRQADALRAYQTVRQRLGDELGITPSPALQLLEEQIILQKPELDWTPPQPARAAAVAAASPLPPPVAVSQRYAFVGREAELDRLRVLWRGARAGATTLAVLSGEAGVGKTRLATEFAREAHAGGARVLFGRWDENPLMPYQPIVECLADVAAHEAPSALDALLGEDAAEIGLMLPSLRRSPAATHRSEPDDPGMARYRLFSAVRNVLGRLSTRMPVVLLLDDIQWADEPTLLLLRHLARPPGLSMLMMITRRDTDTDPRGPVVRMLADLRREIGLQELTLKGLNDDDVASLLNAHPGSAPLARRLLERTGGNAFFLTELIGHLGEAHGELPDGVRAVVSARVARLSETAEHALCTASVIGAQFDLGVLAASLGCRVEEVREGVEEAASRGLAVAVPNRYGGYQFSHAIVQDVLYANLSPAARIELHRAVGTLLEAEAEPDMAPLARHFAAAASAGATEREKAVRYARAAGQQALDRLAYEEAARQFRSALGTLSAVPGSELTRVDVLLDVADAEDRGGDAAAAMEAVLAAAQIARATASPQALSRAALTLSRCRATATSAGVRDRLLAEALSVLPEEDGATRALILAALEEHGVRTGEDAVAMARRLGDDDSLAAALQARLRSLRGPEHRGERLALSAELAALSRRRGDVARTFLAENTSYWARFEAAGFPRPAR